MSFYKFIIIIYTHTHTIIMPSVSYILIILTYCRLSFNMQIIIKAINQYLHFKI